MGKQHRAQLRVFETHRLGIGQPRAARGAVPRVTDGDVAAQLGDVVLVEDLRHKAHLLVHVDVASVTDGDPRRLLTAVLQRVEPEIREVGDVLAGVEDAEDAAFFMQVLVVEMLGERVRQVHREPLHTLRGAH